MRLHVEKSDEQLPTDVASVDSNIDETIEVAEKTIGLLGRVAQLVFSILHIFGVLRKR